MDTEYSSINVKLRVHPSVIERFQNAAEIAKIPVEEFIEQYAAKCMEARLLSSPSNKSLKQEAV